MMSARNDPTLVASGAGAPSSARRIRPGHVVSGRYVVVRALGSGGMGVVYEARHLMLGTTVAVKLLRPELLEERAHVERFEREARYLASLTSQHVVRAVDAGRLETGLPFLVMERLVGTTLAELLRQGKSLGSAAAAEHALAIARGLVDVHAAGLVHRDIKPANLFLPLRRKPSSGLQIIDFGIALERRGGPPLEQSRVILGSPSYAAPEQLEDCRTVDGRADIWSLGVVLFEMLGGRLALDSLRAQREGGTNPMSGLHGLLSARSADRGLFAIVEKCLQRDPSRRFGSAPELVAALLRWRRQANTGSVPRPRFFDGSRPSLSPVLSLLGRQQPLPAPC